MHQVRLICKAPKANTQKPTLQKSLPCANAQATLCSATQNHIIDDEKKGERTTSGLLQWGPTQVISAIVRNSTSVIGLTFY